MFDGNVVHKVPNLIRRGAPQGFCQISQLTCPPSGLVAIQTRVVSRHAGSPASSRDEPGTSPRRGRAGAAGGEVPPGSTSTSAATTATKNPTRAMA